MGPLIVGGWVQTSSVVTHSHSSRSFTPQGGTEPSPGRPARGAVLCQQGRAQHGNMQGHRAVVSRGHSRHRTPPVTGWLGNELRESKSGDGLTLPKGQTKRRGGAPVCSYAVTNPTGGAVAVRDTGQPDPNASLLEEVLTIACVTGNSGVSAGPRSRIFSDWGPPWF